MPDINRTARARARRAAALAEAKLAGDKFTEAMLEADLVDFDPQPKYTPSYCPRHPREEIAAMVGCRSCGDGDEFPRGGFSGGP